MLFRSLFGLLNVAVALWALWLFRHELRAVKSHLVAALATLALLSGAFAGANHITSLAEDKFYQDRIVFSENSPYQRIVVTHGRAGHRLFLNGNLQFAQRDEYRYHEALVHPVMAAHAAPKKVAVLGGGDGMAVREILKYPGVESITLVELDPNMTRLFTRNPTLSALNSQALSSPKVKVVNTDAFKFLETTTDTFDIIIVDFPDPSNFSIGKLYTTSFYGLLDQRLSASGYAVVQTTSPLVARKSFWTVASTVEEAGLSTKPYHANVPSFGEWGFIIASRRPYRAPTALPAGLQFLNLQSLPLLFDFPQDMTRVDMPPNRLSNQVLVTTFEEEWGKVLR